MSDFPALCSHCLGDKDHIKMVRQQGGEECKLCTRPFTVFRWNALSSHKKLKKTIICKTCALARNCCQSCMVDLIYGIPLEIRDAALKMAGIPNEYSVESSKNREVKALIADKQEAKNQKVEENFEEKAHAILEALAEKLAARKALVPDKKSPEINNKDVSKIVAKLPFGGNLVAPEDSSIKSFFVFGIPAEMPQYVLSNYCEKFGLLAQTKVIHRAKCGYVTFLTRKVAEEFASSIRNSALSRNTRTAGLVLLDNKYPIRVSWGTPKPLGASEEHNKIGMVVTKVMKQLAEKDSQPRKENAVVQLARADVEL